MQKLLSPMRKCIRDYQMLSPRDRVVAGVSGGKDSLALLRLLAELREHSSVSFELMQIFVRNCRFPIPFRKPRSGRLFLIFAKRKTPALCAQKCGVESSTMRHWHWGPTR